MSRKLVTLYCDNCGADCGTGTRYYGDFVSCSEPECGQAERDYYRERQAEAQEAAREDNYERYSR